MIETSANIIQTFESEMKLWSKFHPKISTRISFTTQNIEPKCQTLVERLKFVHSLMVLFQISSRHP